MSLHEQSISFMIMKVSWQLLKATLSVSSSTVQVKHVLAVQQWTFSLLDVLVFGLCLARTLLLLITFLG